MTFPRSANLRDTIPAGTPVRIRASSRDHARQLAGEVGHVVANSLTASFEICVVITSRRKAWYFVEGEFVVLDDANDNEAVE